MNNELGQSEDSMDCDKEMETLLAIYSSAATQGQATQRRKCCARFNQGTTEGITLVLQLPAPQRFVQRNKKAINNASSNQSNTALEPSKSFIIDSHCSLQIKDSYDALLATLMNVNE